MNGKNLKIFAIALILLCCFIGAVNAADDVSTDVVSDSIDDVVITEEVDNSDLQSDDISTDLSTADEVVNIDSQKDQSDAPIETNVEEENSRATGTATVSDWTSLRNYAQASGTDYTITLNDSISIGSTNIIFKNNAIIEGTANSCITGSAVNRIPFRTNTNSYNITFRNVKFENINCQMLIQLQTSGISKLENCSFINIITGNGHHSVIYNYWGTMNITGCNFTNCTTGFGVITNHNPMSKTGIILNVKDSKFNNNYALNEPGAINNCGKLTVYNSTFNKNNSTMWAGAIHTHTSADTLIVGSNFTDNIAGYNAPYPWGGGALFTYSNLTVINSTFTGNNCTAASGGGAIGGYSYGSTYNIIIDSCNFIRNANNATNGYGGAIGVQNMGYLTVRNSTFTNNCATNGQAISGICEDVVYCLNCTNCSCPNCTNCTHNVSTGDPYCILNNNTFINHTGSGDTVVISGKNYEFNNNIFINSTQTTHYKEDGNQYGLTNYPAPSASPSFLLSPKLGSSILGDNNNHDKIYVNASSDNSPMDAAIDGQSWETAYGTDMGLLWASSYINNEGVIYLADGIYEQSGLGEDKNFTIIGFNRDLTIFDTWDFEDLGAAEYTANVHSVTKYINLTFKNPNVNLQNGHVFINCTFINPIIKTNEMIYYDWQATPSNLNDIIDSFVVNFTGCNFKNYDIADSLLEAYRYSQINFFNCTFENIAANSIAKQIGGFTLQDAINFYDCTFTNVNVKGIVDVPTGTNPIERYRIEGCTGVPAGSFTEDGRDFVNATQSRTKSVLDISVDSDDNLVVSLKDIDGNEITNTDISISINDGQSTPYSIGDDGTLTIPLSDLTDLKGLVTITVSFEETDDYEGATQTVDYVIRTATSISAEDLTTEVNVAKDLTVTLLDNNNNPIAGKDIIVSVDGVNSTVQTDENGVAKIPISYASAGVHEYTLYFAGDDTTYKGSTKVVKVTVNKASEPATNDTNDTPVGPSKVATKLSAPKVTATYNVAKKLVITLKDKNGKALANKKVTVKVGSISKTLTTNAKGQVSLNVATLVPKTYTATVKFAGDNGYSASSISPKVVVSKAKPKLAAKAKTFKVKAKVKKFTATLKNNKGKVMKKAKLTLKIGKKTYKATTNSKGVATFKVKLTKKGKYTATVKFAGNKYYKALSKKVKITVKK